LSECLRRMKLRKEEAFTCRAKSIEPKRDCLRNWVTQSQVLGKRVKSKHRCIVRVSLAQTVFLATPLLKTRDFRAVTWNPAAEIHSRESPWSKSFSIVAAIHLTGR